MEPFHAILFADTQKAARWISVLQSAQAEAVVLDDPQQVLRQLDEGQTDVVFVHPSMSLDQCVDLAYQTRDLPRDPNLLVVGICSGGQEERVRYFQARVDACLQEDATEEEILAWLMGAGELRALRHQFRASGRDREESSLAPSERAPGDVVASSAHDLAIGEAPDFSEREVPPGRADALVVLDNEEDLAQLMHILNARGYSCVGVSSGTEALAQLARSRFRVVLIDLLMSEVSGWDLIRRLEQQEDDLPVIVMGGGWQENSLDWLEKLRVEGFLKKPFDAAEVEEVLTNCLNPPAPPNRFHILMAYSRLHGLQAVQNRLKRRGYDVRHGASVDALADLLKECPPHLLVLDDDLDAQKDGLALCAHIRRTREFEHLPILFTTYRRDTQTVRKSKQLGIVEYLVKPVSPEAVVARIEEIIRTLSEA